MNKPLPSKYRLDALLSFNPITGEIRWKCKSHVKARINIGEIAGGIFKNPKTGISYRRIMIDKSYYLCHRLMYYYCTNEQPLEVDHKNGNSLDNRLSNLRSADDKLTAENRRKQKNNTSGVIGVCYCKTKHRYITRCNKNYYFNDYFEAICFRKSWENKHGMTEIKKHRPK